MSIEKEKKDYKEAVLKAMSPVKNFNPDDWEPLGEDLKHLSFRARKAPPKELPTFNIKPKEILEGQMIGMYESKQDLYLIMAHRCNDLQKQIDELKKQINK